LQKESEKVVLEKSGQLVLRKQVRSTNQVDTNKIGVQMDTLKEALKVLIDLAEKTDVDLEDGKISIAEGIGILSSAFGLIKVVKSVETIKKEFLGLSNEQRRELSTWFEDDLQLREKSAEQIVEEVFSALLQIGESMKLIAKAE
jgi:hypothetical protein